MKITIISFLISLLYSGFILAAAEQSPLPSSPKINVNNASSAELIGSLKGIGKKRADAIVKYRSEHGNFKSFEELAQVPGLGKNFISKHLADCEQHYTLK